MGSRIIKDDKYSEIDPRSGANPDLVDVKLPKYTVAKDTIARWLARGEILTPEYHERMAVLLSAEKGLISTSDVTTQTQQIRRSYRDENEARTQKDVFSIDKLPDKTENPF